MNKIFEHNKTSLICRPILVQSNLGLLSYKNKAVGSKWILGGGGGLAAMETLGIWGMDRQIILKSRTTEIRFPAFWEVIFYRKWHYKLEVWERVDQD